VTAAPAGPPPLLNIANVLTGVRIVLVPVFVVLLLADGGRSVDWRLAAFGVFALAAATDRLDGELARRRGLVTAFGTIADPIADKALVGAALIGLSVLDQLPWWVTVTILGRELGITLLRFSVLRHGIIPASRGGKAKTLLLPLTELTGASGLVDAARWTVLALALVLTVATGVDYVLRAVRLRAASGAAPAAGPLLAPPDAP
jgi:CDP-diacylglycerol--glycerol-3-phosphate 3-phosphatidyltransferase